MKCSLHGPDKMLDKVKGEREIGDSIMNIKKLRGTFQNNSKRLNDLGGDLPATDSS